MSPKRTAPRLAIEPRLQASWRLRAGALAAALAATLALGSLMFPLFGIAPSAGLHAFFLAPLDSPYGIAELFVKAAPLALIAGGLCLSFRAGVWNIGAEGQFTLGAIGGAGAALFAPVEGPLLLPLALAAGVLAGALWAAIVAALRTLCHANEILSSLMLVYVAELLLLWLVQGPWRDPDGFNFPETALLPEAALLPVLTPGTRLHWGVLFALPVVAGLAVVLARTSFGFGLQVSGDGERAARFAGFRRGRIIWAVLLLSGGLAGLAGAAEVSGVVGQLVPVISPGYGFTAIIVAFLGGLRPLGALAASLLVALTYLGGETAQITLALPHAAAGVFQGLLLFTVLGSGFVLRCRLRLVFPAKAEPGPPATGRADGAGGGSASVSPAAPGNAGSAGG